MMKKIFFLLAITAAAATTNVFGQAKRDSSTVKSKGIEIRGFNSAKPIIYTIDGVKQFNAVVAKNINPNEISEVTVIKGDDAVKLFGIEANGGAVLIATKAGKNSSSNMELQAKLNDLNIKSGVNKISDLAFKSKDGNDSTSTTFISDNNSTVKIRGFISPDKINQPLYIIDGIKIESGSIEFLDPKTIQSVTVLKDSNAIKNYGLAASNGVVLITTKPLKKLKPSTELDKN